MKSKFLWFCVFAFQLSFSQNYPRQYFTIRHEVDSLFSAKAYKEAAEKLTYAINLVGQRVTTEDRIYSASAWALAIIWTAPFISWMQRQKVADM